MDRVVDRPQRDAPRDQCPLACGNPPSIAHAQPGMQHSAARLLRRMENAVGISLLAEPAWLDNRLERTSLRVRFCDNSALAGHNPARRSVSRSWCGRISVVTRVVHVPYVVEQDEDGVWCASAQLRPGVGAVGDGPTAEAAVADLRDALEALLGEVGPPDELTLTLDVA